MKNWPLDRWDFIIFGAWAILVIVGMLYFSTRVPPNEIVQFTIQEPSAHSDGSI